MFDAKKFAVDVGHDAPTFLLFVPSDVAVHVVEEHYYYQCHVVRPHDYTAAAAAADEDDDNPRRVNY